MPKPKSASTGQVVAFIGLVAIVVIAGLKVRGIYVDHGWAQATFSVIFAGMVCYLTNQWFKKQRQV